MPRSLQELFHARSVRELFEGDPPDEITIREAATAELELRPECQRSPLEEVVGAFTPGDQVEGDPWFERNKDFGQGWIAEMMAQAREGHRIADEFPERGAYHGGPPIPDQGGIMQDEPSLKTIGPFVPVPPDQVPPPATGGFKMKIEPFEEFQARRPWPNHRPPEGSTPTAQVPRATGRVVGVARGFPVIQGD